MYLHHDNSLHERIYKSTVVLPIDLFLSSYYYALVNHVVDVYYVDVDQLVLYRHR